MQFSVGLVADGLKNFVPLVTDEFQRRLTWKFVQGLSCGRKGRIPGNGDDGDVVFLAELLGSGNNVGGRLG